MRTKNFKLTEVIHRNNKLPQKKLPIAYAALQAMQMLRDIIGVPLVVSSGYREKAYNDSLPNSSPSSYHIWRFEEGTMKFAVDFHSPSMPLEKLYKRVKSIWNGECYMNKTLNFVHIANTGVKENWIVE